MKFRWLIALSLFLHLSLIGLLSLVPGQQKVQPSPVTFEVLSPKKKSQYQNIVRDQLLPEKIKVQDNDDPVKFLSQTNQRVLEQLRALKSGLTKNSAAEKSKNKLTLDKLLPSSNGLSAKLKNDSGKNSSVSTLAEELSSDIKVGAITALNTDRYLYYSYFSRAQELLYNEWAPYIDSVLENPPAELTLSVHRKFTTQVEVWFYPSGELHSIHLLKPSGINVFDIIATNAFRRVKIIPNPPKEKIESDGLIRFPWSLSVSYTPKVLVRQ